ncbi:MAG: AmmeMemoRadiSam system radical SAM enzyme [Bacteroidales bacterium]|nr:AmmeMemoRadiSam system radical SAM enzyme [Bacteroidales bacterium]
MKEALYYTKLPENEVICELCPHNCRIKEGKAGTCRVRVNKKGILYTETYGVVSAIHVDPIEKKPLYHFYPSSNILSIGTIGCNFRCRFCQNSDISQVSKNDFPYLKPYYTEDIVKLALREKQNLGIAYTYNEPTIFYEYMLEIAREASANNLKNVIVSNGYINLKPLEELIEYIDAFNIDLKAFNNDFYKKYSGGTIEPVKDTLKFIKSRKKHLEITNLLIPTLNDDENEFEEMVKWIANELGENTVFHISRYFPRHKMNIEATPIHLLETFFQIAKKHLHHVFIGNAAIKDGQNTYCSKCNKMVIQRNGYFTYVSGLDIKGNCLNCGEHLVIKES